MQLWREESWAYGAVVDSRVVLCDVVAEVGGAGSPVVAELALECSAS